MNSQKNILKDIRLILGADHSPVEHHAAIFSPDSDTLSHHQLNSVIEQTSDLLRSLHINRTTRVAVILPQGLTSSLTILSIMSCAVCAPINNELKKQELMELFTRDEIDLIITQSSYVDCLSAADSLGLPHLHISTFDPNDIVLAFENSELTTESLKSDKSSIRDRDIRLILHTSGSTSTPKAVPLTLENIATSIRNITDSLSLKTEDRCLNMMPQYHIGGIVDLLLAPLCSGGSVIITPEISMKAFIECVETFSPSWYQAVPTLLHNLAELDEDKIKSISKRPFRFIRSVSSALRVDLLHDIESKMNTAVIEMYGMTETCGLISSNPLPPSKSKPGSVGIPVGCEIRILSDEGIETPLGQAGRIQVRGKNVMSSYLNDEKTRDTYFKDDWFNTGDIGYIDSDGYLYIKGRAKEMINRGGEKISPLEIDRIAEQYDAIAQAATFAVEHDTLGEEVAIALVLKKEKEFDQIDFQRFLSLVIADYKLPKSFHIIESLPFTKGGKLQRQLIQSHIERSFPDEGRSSGHRTATEKTLTEIWHKVLSTEKIHIDDNFFDLGGDSLKAAIFLTELEETISIEGKPPSIYEAPTIRQFASYLEEITHSPIDEETKLPGYIRDSLEKFVSSWNGERREKTSLIIGRNTDGEKRPLFWCINAFREFELFSDTIGVDQPVYGMRSLYHSEYKSDYNNELLAKHYVEEILSIQPDGPYQIGGFCEAAKIAFSIASELRSRGKEVSSLMIQDKFIARPYDQRVAFFVCLPNFNSPYYSFLDAPTGWRKYYGGDLVVYKIRSKHTNLYRQPAIQALCAQVKHEIDTTASKTQVAKDRRNDLQRLPEAAYRSSITTSIDETMPPMHRFTLEVQITNNSDITWLPTDRSGLILCARWTNHRHKPRIWMAGHSRIERSIAPGEMTTVTIALKTPPIFWSWILELDMVDDGVTWFSTKGSTPARHSVKISPLYWMSNKSKRVKAFEI